MNYTAVEKKSFVFLLPCFVFGRVEGGVLRCPGGHERPASLSALFSFCHLALMFAAEPLHVVACVFQAGDEGLSQFTPLAAVTEGLT